MTIVIIKMVWKLINVMVNSLVIYWAIHSFLFFFEERRGDVGLDGRGDFLSSTALWVYRLNSRTTSTSKIISSNRVVLVDITCQWIDLFMLFDDKWLSCKRFESWNLFTLGLAVILFFPFYHQLQEKMIFYRKTRGVKKEVCSFWVCPTWLNDKRCF